MIVFELQKCFSLLLWFPNGKTAILNCMYLNRFLITLKGRNFLLNSHQASQYRNSPCFWIKYILSAFRIRQQDSRLCCIILMDSIRIPRMWKFSLIIAVWYMGNLYHGNYFSGRWNVAQLPLYGRLSFSNLYVPSWLRNSLLPLRLNICHRAHNSF